MGRLLLYGFMALLLALFLIFVSIFLYAFSIQYAILISISKYLILFFIVAAMIDVVILSIIKWRDRKLIYDPIEKPEISVGMTAYNDELSIGGAVRDFKNAENVVKVIVIDNNCTDNTVEEARKAGATVEEETVQGYGAACIRALKEARKYGNIVVLVEGDRTFSSADLKKLYAYIENADMVIGTRTTAEIVSPDSQVNWFMSYGNLFMAKLIQMRYWGKLRLTDVGCTFRMIRPEALDKIMNQLSVVGNHFSLHMILIALKNDLKIIEVPVTLRERVGESKGVGASISKGLLTGFKMLWLILKS
jgi:glycosyltransferase involved in cell wall biosynthesis